MPLTSVHDVRSQHDVGRHFGVIEQAEVVSQLLALLVRDVQRHGRGVQVVVEGTDLVQAMHCLECAAAAGVRLGCR